MTLNSIKLTSHYLPQNQTVSYSEEIRFVDNLFQSFLASLKNKEPGTSIIKTSEGKNAYTFQCSLSEGDKTYFFVTKVLKNARQVAHELAGNTYVEQFSLNSPSSNQYSQTLNREEASLIVKEAELKTSQQELSGYSLLCMEKIQGKSLAQFFLTGKYQEIKDWTSIQEQFGEIAVLDLFMGNLDRFFGVQGRNFIPKVNFGNVMLTENLDTIQVTFIDNPPIQEIVNISSLSVEEKVNEIKSLQLPPRIKQRKIQELESQGTQFTPEIVNSLNKLFQGVLCDKEKKKTFSDAIIKGLEQQVIDCLHKEDKREALSHLSHYLTNLEVNIERGIEKGLQRIKEGFSINLQEEILTQLSPAFLLLIEKNNNTIKNS